ncbi:Uncharacterized conserved protein, DUF2252 family [Nitrosospira sp. Nsp11]|uniref:DUF2252 family protein n=1 Tax=Nitrosospira sp. Nsp11 TaxID=1855338 RepID=UPI000922367C|nr:DUF2252 family protein [Nitrosospira sp. Nsp11]SHL71335.1 Uncharacterized conserved protein, DUF2252 family [Nitrosospira sp. Nsp11]
MKRAPSKPPAPDARDATLAAYRRHKMARSVHAFVRGNTAQFYEWLSGAEGRALPQGPPIWIAGDCHVGNLGPIGNIEGKINVQIRDLDQTVIGNPAHDLIRLGLSLATAARDSDLSGVVTTQMIEQLMAGYEDCFDGNKEKGGSPRPEMIKVTVKEAASRSWKDLAKERIEDPTPHIPVGEKFWPISKEEKKTIEKIFEKKNVFCHITPTGTKNEDTAAKVLDAAYWIKGCSSLGKLRYAVLLDIKNGKNGKTGRCLIDIKEAVKAVAPAYPGSSMPEGNGERVLEGARRLAPYLGDRMITGQILGRSVFIRELLPQDMKIQIKQLTQDEARKLARYLAAIVGRAHARQMDVATQKLWKKELQHNRAKNLDAPSWLWSSIVELVANHAGSYLEHCRKYSHEKAAH